MFWKKSYPQCSSRSNSQSWCHTDVEFTLLPLMNIPLESSSVSFQDTYLKSNERQFLNISSRIVSYPSKPFHALCIFYRPFCNQYLDFSFRKIMLPQTVLIISRISQDSEYLFQEIRWKNPRFLWLPEPCTKLSRNVTYWKQIFNLKIPLIGTTCSYINAYVCYWHFWGFVQCNVLMLCMLSHS